MGVSYVVAEGIVVHCSDEDIVGGLMNGGRAAAVEFAVPTKKGIICVV